MSKPPKYWNKAKKYLSKKDRVMKILIEKYKQKTLKKLQDKFDDGKDVIRIDVPLEFTQVKDADGNKLQPKKVHKDQISVFMTKDPKNKKLRETIHDVCPGSCH